MTNAKPWLWHFRGHRGLIFAPSRNAAVIRILEDCRRAGERVRAPDVTVRRYYPAWMEVDQ